MRRVFRVQDEKLIRTAREKDKILEMLRQRGMRVTKQRKLILDIVFAHECTCCKEIYYQALKEDKNMGIATVYRMVNVLTDLGVFQVNAPYRFSGQVAGDGGNGCRIVLKNQKVVEFDQEEWRNLLTEALQRKGCADTSGIERVIL